MITKWIAQKRLENTSFKKWLVVSLLYLGLAGMIAALRHFQVKEWMDFLMGLLIGSAHMGLLALYGLRLLDKARKRFGDHFIFE